MITQDELKRLLNYCPDTGVFTWRVLTGHRVRVDGVAGTLRSNGYVQISINGKVYRAHRLAWLYVYGYMPPTLDHINRVRNDNRILNLRPATYSENHQNRSLGSKNTSGFIGVSICKRTGMWQAQIKVNKKPHHLGRFDTPEEASRAYNAAKMHLHTFNPIVQT